MKRESHQAGRACLSEASECCFFCIGGKENVRSWAQPLIHKYHWRDLPQFFFFFFCRDEHKRRGLSRQKYARRDKTFVTAKLFVATKDVLSLDKRVFVATKIMLVASPCYEAYKGSQSSSILLRGVLVTRMQKLKSLFAGNQTCQRFPAVE